MYCRARIACRWQRSAAQRGDVSICRHYQQLVSSSSSNGTHLVVVFMFLSPRSQIDPLILTMTSYPVPDPITFYAVSGFDKPLRIGDYF